MRDSVCLLGLAMSLDGRDLSKLGTAELLEAFVQNVRAERATNHVGRSNRLIRRSGRIVNALKARTDGTVRSLLPLLSDSDPFVQLAAAIHCKEIDPATYRQLANALAERKDQVGEEARRKLHWDALFETLGSIPSGPTRYPEGVFWRSRRAPPAGLTRPKLEQLLRGRFAAELATALLALARRAIGLWPRRPAADSPMTASRLGNMPCVPAGWSWPTYETEPLFFLGQINCADLAGLPSAAPLPSKGLLAFFGDHDAVNGCGVFDDRQAVVYYWPAIEALAPTAPPIEDFEPLPVCALCFFETIELPDPWSSAIKQLGLDGDAKEKYWELREAVRLHGLSECSGRDTEISKLLGWPDLVQTDWAPLLGPDDSSGCRLLLQLSSYENGAEMQEWGPGGLLYFSICEEDLRRCRFDRAYFEMQST